KQQLTFKRDPRDISVLYLLEPNTQFYHRVPYRNTSRPSISVWEYRASVRQLKKQGAEKLDENAIFAAYERMRSLELAAVEKTQRHLRPDVAAMLDWSTAKRQKVIASMRWIPYTRALRITQ
nr:hypothetical protein [Tanacetum cinerariifolium]